MSRFLETVSSAPSSQIAPSADQLWNNLLAYNPFEPYLQMQEMGSQLFAGVISVIEPVAVQQIRTLEMTDELLGTGAELQRFELLKYSDPSLYYGTPETRGNKRMIMANGFSPYNPMTENVFATPVMSFYQDLLPFLRPNAILEPKRKWYERHGHTATFAFDGPNHIWYQNFIDTYEAVLAALETGDDVWIDGLSAGGMLGEMVAKKFAKKGKVVNLITHGSPEVNEEILELFEESTQREGMMGQVHNLAKLSAELDPDGDKMLDEIYEAATGSFHPDSQVVRFYSDDDRVCPKPLDPRAIEVGGKHAVIPYRVGTLRREQEMLAANRLLQNVA